ncbi:mucin-associated surface protein (MASP) [Trypanosoma cruzi]|nr:mucin-associated surface protein (MASP) [Trypanosoma cruzi]
MASGGFGRNKSFLPTGSSKNLSTPPLLSASFISAIQAEAREGEVSSPGVTDSPLSGATGLSPAFSGLGPAVPGPGPGFVHGHVHGPAGPGDGAAAFSGLGAAGPDPVAAIPGAAVPGTADPAAIPGSAVPGHGAIPGSISDAAIPGPASPGAAAAFSSLGAAFSGAGHSVVGGSEPPNSRSVVISSNQGGNGKTAPVSVSSDEQIVSPQEVLAQKETGSQHTSLPEEQPTVSSNNEKQRNNFASAGGRTIGHNAAGDELQDSLEEQNKNEHSQTNETKKSSGDQITEFQSSGKEISEVSNTTTHGVKTQQPKTNSVNEKNYSQNTDASHTTSPLLLLLVVACAAAAAVVAA